jgi:hypothetical protein
MFQLQHLTAEVVVILFYVCIKKPLIIVRHILKIRWRKSAYYIIKEGIAQSMHSLKVPLMGWERMGEKCLCPFKTSFVPTEMIKFYCS